MTEKTEIWDGDVLDRRSAASFLQKYLNTRYLSKPSEPGFVLAINAEWGYGKSFLIERWQHETRVEKYPSVYFDAWQNDFTSNPLLAFIAELEEGLSSHFGRVPIAKHVKKKTLRLLGELWKPALTIIATAGAKHLVGLSLPKLAEVFETEDHASDENSTESDGTKKSEAKADSDNAPSFEKIAENLKGELDKALAEHKTVKVALKIFKERLTALIEYLSEQDDINLPIYIFVDELDRCRPNYAIELLEGIKHLFGVPGVYFVVATNLSQLSESVKAVYGAGFDGERYLKRFFDLQYTLGAPSNDNFAQFLVRNMAISDEITFVHGLDRYQVIPRNGYEPLHTKTILSYVFSRYADALDLPLRDQKQIAVLIEAGLYSLPKQAVHIFFLVFLAVLYQQDAAEFRRVSSSHEISESSSVIRSLKANKKGRIVGTSSDGNGTRSVSWSLLDVAQEYLANISKNLARRDYQENFPQNLLNDAKSKKDGLVFWASYKEYFDIIQQAGGFSGTLN